MTSAEILCIERLTVSREKLRRGMEFPASPSGSTSFATNAVASIAQLGPYAQKNPLTLVTVAFLAGGALAWSRPKRSSLAGVLIKTLVPQLVPVVTAAVTQPAWIEVMGAVLRQSHQPRD